MRLFLHHVSFRNAVPTKKVISSKLVSEMLDRLLKQEDSDQQDTNAREAVLQIERSVERTQQNAPHRQSALMTSKLSMKTQGSLELAPSRQKDLTLPERTSSF